MSVLLLVVGLMLGAVILVGVGDRLRLPWPALMVVLGAVVAFVPGLPAHQLDPDLILPLFLPPLLFATAQRTSWALFRARWRTIALLAVALVVATVAAVAGTAAALIPGLGVTAAITLGAILAPPDPVAVEAVAGPVRMPRRLLDVLDSEGLFNDATAVVIFQVAVLATVQGATDVSLFTLLWRFVLGAVGAVVLGLAVARVARWVDDHVSDTAGRSALTVVLPFAVYLAAEEIGVSGVVAVVVVALQTRDTSDVDEAAERLVQRSFWDVVEMLVTGVAFGLVGLELRGVVADAGSALPRVLAHAAVVIGVVLAVRTAWMVIAWPVLRHSSDGSAAPRTGREAVVLTWCGMRGLATLALALSLPTTTASGAAFPARAEIVVVAAATLVATLVVPAFTLPTLVRLLGVAEDADVEHAAERVVTQRARQAAYERLREVEQRSDLPDDVTSALHDRMERLEPLLRGESPAEGDRERLEELHRSRHVVQRIQSEMLAAARAEVLAARRTPGVDPHAADRVLQRLDLRTVLLD